MPPAARTAPCAGRDEGRGRHIRPDDVLAFPDDPPVRLGDHPGQPAPHPVPTEAPRKRPPPRLDHEGQPRNGRPQQPHAEAELPVRPHIGFRHPQDEGRRQTLLQPGQADGGQIPGNRLEQGRKGAGDEERTARAAAKARHARKRPERRTERPAQQAARKGRELPMPTAISPEAPKQISPVWPVRLSRRRGVLWVADHGGAAAAPGLAERGDSSSGSLKSRGESPTTPARSKAFPRMRNFTQFANASGQPAHADISRSSAHHAATIALVHAKNGAQE